MRGSRARSRGGTCRGAEVVGPRARLRYGRRCRSVPADSGGGPNGGFTFGLEFKDGTPADPPTLQARRAQLASIRAQKFTPAASALVLPSIYIFSVQLKLRAR